MKAYSVLSSALYIRTSLERSKLIMCSNFCVELLTVDPPITGTPALESDAVTCKGCGYPRGYVSISYRIRSGQNLGVSPITYHRICVIAVNYASHFI
jgi:hypothetical protein